MRINYNIKPLKRLGQNFLIDKKILKKIIETAQLKPSDIVLEIGPGLGVLTKELAKRVKKVIAVEKDPRMCQILAKVLKDFKNVEIIQGDILKIPNAQYPISNKMSNTQCQNSKIVYLGIRNFIGNWKSCPAPKEVLVQGEKIGNYKIVANLPYYITSPVIRKFLELEQPPKIMVLTIQKEVAQRICPRPPTSSAEGDFVGRRPKLEERRRDKPLRMNLLAISVQFYAKPEIISYVSKKSFWPKPKVDSAIIKIVPSTSDRLLRKSSLKFFKIVKAGFAHPRKQLANNLAEMLKLNKIAVIKILQQNNIQPSQRAETLTIKDWLKLTNMLK